MNTIRIAAKRCGPNNFGWKNYDEQFRLTIAGNSSASWREIDLELFFLIYVYDSTQAGVQLVSNHFLKLRVEFGLLDNCIRK